MNVTMNENNVKPVISYKSMEILVWVIWVIAAVFHITVIEEFSSWFGFIGYYLMVTVGVTSLQYVPLKLIGTPKQKEAYLSQSLQVGWKRIEAQVRFGDKVEKKLRPFIAPIAYRVKALIAKLKD